MRDPARNETVVLVSGKRVGACLFFVYISNRTILELKRIKKPLVLLYVLHHSNRTILELKRYFC